MNTPEEKNEFIRLHSAALAKYRAGSRVPVEILDPADAKALSAYGIRVEYLYDCVDDLERYGEPSLDTFLALAAIRSAHFQKALGRKEPPRIIQECELPPKTQEYKGVPWLPRIIRKAQHFLEGSMCPDIMYGCAGDRGFLAKYAVDLPDFLAKVRDSNGDPEALYAYIQKGP